MPQVQILSSLPYRPLVSMVARWTPNPKVRVQILYGLPKKRLDNEVKICDNRICEVERESILMIGAPPSVGGGGVARPPREKNFYIIRNQNSKLLFSTLSKGTI